ncbi:hypothetical protein SCAR479_09110 [Seiridium cardinale]|uniref:Uncharacterized protein n=1 Tax=Seiridium cardinale TaxID=138064 RepID=A0ABR2XKG3_9PEZI
MDSKDTSSREISGGQEKLGSDLNVDNQAKLVHLNEEHDTTRTRQSDLELGFGEKVPLFCDDPDAVTALVEQLRARIERLRTNIARERAEVAAHNQAQRNREVQE